jgi:RecB family exonuclease
MSATITMHECDCFDTAVQTAISPLGRHVIVTLQPLMVPKHPHALPLAHLLRLDATHHFMGHSALLQALCKRAPSFSKKSCRAIAVELEQLGVFYSADIQPQHAWIHWAIHDFHGSAEGRVMADHWATAIQHATEWINHHYDSITFVGLNAPNIPLVLALCNGIRCPINWVIPSMANHTHTVDIQMVPDWLDTWAAQPMTIKQNTPVNAFSSLSDECEAVVEWVRTTNTPIALVAPNDTIRSRVAVAANRAGISIATSPCMLIRTQLGSAIDALCQWAQYPTLDQLNDVVHAWPWPNMADAADIIRQEHHIVHARLHPKARPNRLFSAFPSSHFIHHILNVTCIESLFHFFKAHLQVDYRMDDHGHYLYRCSQWVNHILSAAISSAAPWEMAHYMLHHTPIGEAPFNEPMITWVDPEAIGRVTNTRIWVMGFGFDSWLSGTSGTRIATESISNPNQIQAAIRHAMGRWCLSHPNTIGVSHANSSEAFNPALSVTSPIHLQLQRPATGVPYRRPLPNIGAPLAVNRLSPSMLHLYHVCPYAFYVQHGLKVHPKEPESEPQVFGMLMHHVLENIVTKTWSSMGDIAPYLNAKFRPLMAIVLGQKIASHWAIDDLTSFFNGIDADIHAEVPLSMTINGVQLNGRADAMIHTSDGIDIIDLKTGSMPTARDIATFQHLQLGLYGLMMLGKEQLPITGQIIGKGPTIKSLVHMDPSEPNTYIAPFTDYIESLIEQMRMQQFYATDGQAATPHKAAHCRICDYYSICSYQQRHQR